MWIASGARIAARSHPLNSLEGEVRRQRVFQKCQAKPRYAADAIP